MKENPKKRAILTLKSAELALQSLKSVDLSRAIDRIGVREGNIVVTGIGKSGFIGQKISATLTSLGSRSVFLHPVEAIHGDLGAVGKGDVVLAISASGESNEVVRLVKYLRKDFDVGVISLTRSKFSSLGKLSDVVLEIDIKDEGCPLGLAPMASTTATLVLGDMLAAALTNPDVFKRNEFARFHPGGSLALKIAKVKTYMRRGNALPIVRESNSFKRVLQVITAKKLGATGVINARGKLVGIITDGDIRRFLISHGDMDSQARDLMTKNPKYIKESDTLEAALAKIESYKITHLFVVRETKPVGIIHIHDIVERTLTNPL